MPVFDETYRETAVLRDGSRVLLRLVTPGDKRLLVRGFERLSPTSRHRRFLASKNQLTEAELAYFTEVDQRDHFAIGAIATGDGGEGVGIARFIRCREDPSAAEAAVAVVDDWQRKGLGTLLLLRLAAAARERGIDRFTGQVLSSNAEMRDLLAQVGAASRIAAGGDDALSVDVDLRDVPAAEARRDPPDTMLRRIFGLIARGLPVGREAR